MTETTAPTQTPAERAEFLQTLIGQAEERIAKLKSALSLTEGVLRSHNMVIAFPNGLCMDLDAQNRPSIICDILVAPRVEKSQAETVRRMGIRNGLGEQATLRFDREVLQSQLDAARRNLDWLNGLD
jgi:hypothetical protein